MNTPFTFDRTVQRRDFDSSAGRVEQPARYAESAADGSSIRWVFAATVLFWVVVYAAGRSFF